MRVVVTDPVHIAPWGVFVSTPEVSSTSAKVQIAMQVKNDTADDASFSVKTVLVAPSGARSRESVVAIAVQSNQLAEAKQEIVLSQPRYYRPLELRTFIARLPRSYGTDEFWTKSKLHSESDRSRGLLTKVCC